MNQLNFTFSTLEEKEVLEKLDSSLIKGLSTSEVQYRLNAEGFNEYENQKVQWWHILLRQLQSPFIYLLALAAILAIFLGEVLDAAIIFLFIFINTFLGFYQEFKSEQTLKLLKQYTKSRAKVIRDGTEQTITSDELVRGDIVLIDTGDLIPADIRLTSVNNLVVDETVLTGESIAVHKNSQLLTTEPKDIYESINLVFEGTTVVQGSGNGIVIATGKNSAFGHIKKLTSETNKESAFAKGISAFSSFILKLTAVTLVFVFIANIAIKGESANVLELLVFSIALAVSVIPEALPLVTTVSLSQGVLRLVKRKVITKRLSAIEDLGSIEMLCTDKTGTLTENKLTVDKMYKHGNSSHLLLYANLSGSGGKESLEPFDVALVQALPTHDDVSSYKRLNFIPFDPKRRRNSVLVQSKNNGKTLIVRGAPETIVDLCLLKKSEESKIKQWIQNEGLQGHRVLAIASKEIKGKNVSDITQLESEMQFDGCISFVDPVKNSTFVAVQKAKKLGISIRIITGDSLEVSANVAMQIGLPSDSANVTIAADFVNLPATKQKKLLPDISVFARTNPEQKHYIVKLLQDKYNVGFLGEGINDAPALKAAGVSIVVQSASDIAREAADIILLKKDLSVIIDGIEEGRRIFANTIKYLKATLASNFGNFYAVAIGSLFINFLPMLPIQLLLVNLLSDFPMIAIATDRVDFQEIQEPKKYNAKDVVLIATILGIVSTVFDFIFFGFFYKISPDVLQTNWFIGSILTELVFMFSVRTQLPFYKAAFPSKFVLWLTLGAFVTTIILPYTSIGQTFFHFTPPSAYHLALILTVVGAYFVCSEIVKNMYYKGLGKSV